MKVSEAEVPSKLKSMQESGLLLKHKHKQGAMLGITHCITAAGNGRQHRCSHRRRQIRPCLSSTSLTDSSSFPLVGCVKPV